MATSIITGAFKAYPYDDRTGETFDDKKWFESILLDFNSFSSTENDPIVEYKLYYYQSKTADLIDAPEYSAMNGPVLAGTITGKKILGSVNQATNASSWGDRGYWFRFGLRAVTQSGNESDMVMSPGIFRKSLAYAQVFNGNTATSGNMAHIYQFSGYPIILPSNGFSKTGHTFVGWTENSDGTGTAYSAGQKVSTLDAAVRNWWAKWSANPYILTVNPNGGTWNGSTSVQTFTQNYGTTKTISNPTRVGYTFAGWTLSGSGSLSGTTYTYGAGNGTLTAKWTRIVLTVTFDAATNGGTPNSTRDVYYGDTVGTLPTPKKTYYKFVGWFTKTSGGTQISASQVITSNVTYYAQFKIDASVKIGQNGEKTPAIVWVGQNGVWSKVVAWLGEKGIWNKSTGAD